MVSSQSSFRQAQLTLIGSERRRGAEQVRDFIAGHGGELLSYEAKGFPEPREVFAFRASDQQIRTIESDLPQLRGLGGAQIEVEREEIRVHVQHDGHALEGMCEGGCPECS